jgi:hypothetical protein
LIQRFYHHWNKIHAIYGLLRTIVQNNEGLIFILSFERKKPTNSGQQIALNFVPWYVCNSISCYNLS